MQTSGGSRLNRWPAVVAVSALGVGLGLCGDLLDGSASDLPTSLLLSPVAVTVGAFGVTIRELHLPLLIGGCLFWPGYALLCWFWACAPSKGRLDRVAGILSA